jgi:hypothetical protein
MHTMSNSASSFAKYQTHNQNVLAAPVYLVQYCLYSHNLKYKNIHNKCFIRIQIGSPLYCSCNKCQTHNTTDASIPKWLWMQRLIVCLFSIFVTCKFIKTIIDLRTSFSVTFIFYFYWILFNHSNNH